MISFEQYVKLSKSEKHHFLESKYIYLDGRKYPGLFDKTNGLVLLDNIRNPFNDQPMTAIIIGDAACISDLKDGEKIEVFFSRNESGKYELNENSFLLATYRDSNKLIEAERKKRAEEKSRQDRIAREKELEREREKEKLEQMRAAKREEHQRRELLEMLKRQYGFNGFYHYTSFDNFLNIMEIGCLLSRDNLEKQSIEFTDSASKEVLERTEDLPFRNVRLFYAPKTPFLYVTEGIKSKSSGDEHMPIPVALLINESIAFEKDVTFLEGSGGHLSSGVMYRSNCTTSAQEALNYRWNLIFSRGPLPTWNNNITSIYGERDKGVIKNHRNAEFLYPQKLETKQIKSIVFRTEADMKTAAILLGEDERYCVDNNYNVFNYHPDINYITDYNIYVLDDKLTINLTFHTANVDAFRHTIGIVTEKEAFRVDVSDEMEIVEKLRATIEYRDVEVYNAKEIYYYINGNLSAAWKEEK